MFVQQLATLWFSASVATAQSIANHTDCGRRVVGELSAVSETVTTEQPWLVGIYMIWSANDTDWSYRTSGTLISTNLVVTAAYDVTDFHGDAIPVSRLRLVAGKHLLRYDVTEPAAQARNVTSLRLHEHYSEVTRVHDIALLRADEPFVFTRRVNSACVDWSGLLAVTSPGQRVLTTGLIWDATASGWLTSSQPAAILSLAECRSSARDNQLSYVSSEDLCARTSGNATCDGVEGGGLLVLRDARVYLLGVRREELAATETAGCLGNRLYSFTALSRYTSWIRSQSNDTLSTN